VAQSIEDIGRGGVMRSIYPDLGVDILTLVVAGHFVSIRLVR
jgi:hypothetical protein